MSDRPLYGSRPNPADAWKQLEDMLAVNPNGVVPVTAGVFRIIRDEASDDIANHQYKDRLIQQKMNQVGELSILAESGFTAARELYKKEPLEVNRLANNRETKRLIGSLREIATKKDLQKHDLVAIGAIVSAVLYEEHSSNLNHEIIQNLTSIDYGK